MTSFEPILNKSTQVLTRFAGEVRWDIHHSPREQMSLRSIYTLHGQLTIVCVSTERNRHLYSGSSCLLYNDVIINGCLNGLMREQLAAEPHASWCGVCSRNLIYRVRQFSILTAEGGRSCDHRRGNLNAFKQCEEELLFRASFENESGLMSLAADFYMTRAFWVRLASWRSKSCFLKTSICVSITRLGLFQVCSGRPQKSTFLFLCIDILPPPRIKRLAADLLVPDSFLSLPLLAQLCWNANSSTTFSLCSCSPMNWGSLIELTEQQIFQGVEIETQQSCRLVTECWCKRMTDNVRVIRAATHEGLVLVFSCNALARRGSPCTCYDVPLGYSK